MESIYKLFAVDVKIYVAKTSCNQLLLIDSFCYVYAHQDLFTGCHNVAMCLYSTSRSLPSTHSSALLLIPWCGWRENHGSRQYATPFEREEETTASMCLCKRSEEKDMCVCVSVCVCVCVRVRVRVRVRVLHACPLIPVISTKVNPFSLSVKLVVCGCLGNSRERLA